MAAVAAEQVNLIALHLGTRESAVDMFAHPHSGIKPSRYTIAATDLVPGTWRALASRQQLTGH